MIYFIVTDHIESYEKGDTYARKAAKLALLANDECRVLHWSELKRECLHEDKPWAICHSGGTSTAAMESEDYQYCVLEYGVPQLAFCAGHQLCGSLFGGEIGPMRALREGEVDVIPDWFPGQYKERGFKQIALSDDRLFAGLSGTGLFWQNHRYHLTRLGDTLTSIATSENCEVESWRHPYKLFYGVQFHPEEYDDEHPDGKTVIRNFFEMAKVHGQPKPTEV